MAVFMENSVIHEGFFMKRSLNGLSLIAAVAVVGLAISSCSSSDSDAEKGSAQGATTEQSTSAAEADAGDAGKSLKSDVADHLPEQVGEWKSKESGFAGLAAWSKDNEADFISADGTGELSAKKMAKGAFTGSTTRIATGYCGVEDTDSPTCYLDIKGGSEITLNGVGEVSLDDLASFAKGFTEAAGTD
ncbi:hypothetical protein [Galactobacter sp.]|uniref:hypothetical protein n=1 Tax=Galactobacter sp. TaxID=2676125 RepID=UPI0025B8CEE2|nr:hypothetical protein [Galactobacter sp.]